MASSHTEPATKLVNLERELVCFICTEVLYQPLSILDCLHPFCGACLKEWFSHQYRKATSSRSSSSSSYPYTCPTCRAPVKDVQPNAMINTFLDMFLEANPDRARSEEEKQEMAQIYKPGDKIMPRVDGRRRERRSRRDQDGVEAHERRMLEEAQERSLRELHDTHSTHQNSLQPPAADQRDQASRSREREERRQRRREQARQEHQQRADVNAADSIHQGHSHAGQDREDITNLAPSSSPRHPEAVEERQRQQTVVHRASLASLINSTDSGGSPVGGDSDSLTESRIMEEIQILAEQLGLLDGIDVDAMTETEQDALAESIADAYRRRERNRRNNPSSETTASSPPASNRQSSNNLQVSDVRGHQRTESGGRQRRADTMPQRSRDNSVIPQPHPSRAETQPLDGSQSVPPQSTVILTHRRRTSSQGQRSDDTRNRSRQSSRDGRPRDNRSATTRGTADTSQFQDFSGTDGAAGPGHTLRQGTSSPHEPEISQQIQRNVPRSSDILNSSQSTGVGQVAQAGTALNQHMSELETENTDSSHPVAQNAANRAVQIRRRTSGLFDEPSISCFRCHRADIQYQVYRHCDKCQTDLCQRCYRASRGCKHWYGFGHAAMARFESSGLASFEQMEYPHSLVIGRCYKRPEDQNIVRSKLAKDGSTVIPLQTTSDPVLRFQEGRFCDRCDSFANSCFFSCDYCNYGEWGFCRDCVNTHHCCTHPLLPSAHKLHMPVTKPTKPVDEGVGLHANDHPSSTLRPSPIPSQPSSAASFISNGAGPLPDFINLDIPTNCDICMQPIQPSAHRFHCPSHHSPTPTNSAARGDYDICSPCYHNLVKTNRIKREDGTAGWRKCPSGHRMIITTFQPDHEGGQRRVVISDLVGGWKTEEEAIADWNSELEARRQTTGDETSLSSFAGVLDSSTARRLARARTDSYQQEQSYPMTATVYHSNSRFPPDGGTGLRGVAWWSYFPEDDGPNDLRFPTGAEITEIRMNDDYPDWCGGVYAGDRGLLPSSYVRI